MNFIIINMLQDTERERLPRGGSLCIIKAQRKRKCVAMMKRNNNEDDVHSKWGHPLYTGVYYVFAGQEWEESGMVASKGVGNKLHLGIVFILPRRPFNV